MKGSKQFARTWDELTKVITLAAYARHPGEDVQCPVCDRYNQDDARFCDQCGTSLAVSKPGYTPQPYDSGGEGSGEPVTCPYCGQGDAADAKFCDQCGHRLPPGTGASLAHELSADTGRLASTPAPRGKPGGPGLYGVRGNQHSQYMQNIVKALIEKRGMPPGKAYAIAWGAMRKWSKGGGKVHPEVRAAAAGGLGLEKAAAARAHAHAGTWDDLGAVIDLAAAPVRVPAGQGGGGQFGSGGTAPVGPNPAQKAQQKAALLATARDDRAKAAVLGQQRSVLRKALASASGAVSKGQSGAKTKSSAPAKKTAAKKTPAATAAKAKATAAAKSKAATAAKAKAPGSAANTANITVIKGQIAALNTQINGLLAAANAATAQAAAIK